MDNDTVDIQTYLRDCTFSRDRKRAEEFSRNFLSKTVYWNGIITRINNGSIDLVVGNPGIQQAIPNVKLRMSQQCLKQNLPQLQPGTQMNFYAKFYQLRLLPRSFPLPNQFSRSYSDE